MMPIFEVVLISIDWESSDKVRSIKPSKTSLKIISQDQKNYHCDLVMYHKEQNFYFQFAIKSSLTPLVINVDSGKIVILNRLVEVEKGTWIIKGEWTTGARGIGYHKCPSINTPGKILIGLTSDLKKVEFYLNIDINPSIEDFDFDQLKMDFEGELWDLITSNKSIASAEKTELKYSDKKISYPTNQAIDSFLKAFIQIVESPKVELSSSKEYRKREKVVPIIETYRKISVGGMSSTLPSKTLVENSDIFENQFSCYMLSKVSLLVSNNVKFNSIRIERLKSEIDALQQKIKILENPDPKVNPELIKQEIIYQNEKVKKNEVYWNEINSSLKFIPSLNYSYLKIVIKNVQNTNPNCYWCSTEEIAFGLIELQDCIISLINVNQAYLVEGVFTYIEDFKSKKGELFPKYKLSNVRKIVSTDVARDITILNKQIANYKILESKGWSQFEILTPNDKAKYNTEQKNQVKTLSNTIKKINCQLNNLCSYNNEQLCFVPLITQQIKSSFFNKINWKKVYSFKPSMTFLQNRNYRNALKYYKEILKSEGIDIEIFDLYKNTTSFGLREMPQLYELWCLVSQVIVLRDSFHFIPYKDDLKKLLVYIDPDKTNISDHIEINFLNDLAGSKVKMHYQKTIANNNRPDFIMELSSKDKTIDLILDSKFKNYNYKQSIILDSMDMNLKYGGGNNYVFILHPCKDGQYENKQIKYSNLGGQQIFNTSNELTVRVFPFHKYGYLEVKPNNTDNLKKVIAMGFEYLLQQSLNAKRNDNTIDPKSGNDMFCLNCGGIDINITAFQRGTNRFHYNCTCKDAGCGHQVHIDYCWNCKTKLFKHGSYWDYHLESNWSIFDIHCPNCGLTVADMPALK